MITLVCPEKDTTPIWMIPAALLVAVGVAEGAGVSFGPSVGLAVAVAVGAVDPVPPHPATVRSTATTRKITHGALCS
jgi:hypothetical protein